MPRCATLSVAVALGLVAAACAGERSQTSRATDGESIVVAGETVNNHGARDVRNADADYWLHLELNDFYFAPTVVTGVAGQNVSVVLFNKGDSTHTFTIDALGIDAEVAPGGRSEAEVTLAEFGTLLFYCRFHSRSGMRGGLSVGGYLNPFPGSAPKQGSNA
jgi:plastocyanin